MTHAATAACVPTRVVVNIYPFRWQIVANLQRFCMDRILAK